MLLSFYDDVCSMRTMYIAKRGKAAPAAEWRMLLAARAEAALRMDLAFITIFYRSEIVGRKRHGDLRDEKGIDDVIHALQEEQNSLNPVSNLDTVGMIQWMSAV